MDAGSQVEELTMDQNEKSLEEMFEEVSISPEELEQAKGGATASLSATRTLSSVFVRDRAVALVAPALVSDLSSFFNTGLGALNGGLVFRPDQDTGH
jgi:hypothetical protein